MTVLFAGQQIPKSPFEVTVDKALGDASKVTARGPGLEPLGNVANKPTYFEIYTAGLCPKEEAYAFKTYGPTISESFAVRSTCQVSAAMA